MKRGLATLAVATAALLTLGGTSQAGDINIRITMSDRGSAYPARYFDRDHHAGDIQCIRAPCFPARERPRWDHWGRGHGYGRPVLVRRGGWGRYDDDCRTIIKRRVNHWGESVTERTKVCY